MTESQRPAAGSTMEVLECWRRYMRGQMQQESDLTVRQQAVLLTVYLRPAPHTIKSLAEMLDIPKSAICRALDVLCRDDLLRRKRDEQDRRSVFVQRTVKGSVYLADCAAALRQDFAPAFQKQTETV